MMPEVRHLTLICQWPPCSKPFEVHVVRFRDTLRKFCSRRCSLRYGMPLRDTGTLADHFWAKVVKGSPNACWLWQASKGSTGYGTLYVLEQRRLVGAHVVSYFLHYDAWPPEDMCVLHNCPGGDQPSCVNPTHLWLGTRMQNSQDMVSKDRYANGQTKLSEEQAEEMRLFYATGNWTYAQLAERFDVSVGSPWYVIKKRKPRIYH
jgi:hypothetical protein